MVDTTHGARSSFRPTRRRHAGDEHAEVLGSVPRGSDRKGTLIIWIEAA